MFSRLRNPQLHGARGKINTFVFDRETLDRAGMGEAAGTQAPPLLVCCCPCVWVCVGCACVEGGLECADLGFPHLPVPLARATAHPTFTARQVVASNGVNPHPPRTLATHNTTTRRRPRPTT